MTSTEAMHDLNTTCRTCLTTNANELVSINSTIESDVRIIDYFQYFLHINVLECDKLPQNICLNCLDKLLEVQKFYTQCIESEKILLGTVNIKNENDLSGRVEVFFSEFTEDVEEIRDDTCADIIECSFSDASNHSVGSRYINHDSPTEEQTQSEALEESNSYFETVEDDIQPEELAEQSAMAIEIVSRIPSQLDLEESTDNFMHQTTSPQPDKKVYQDTTLPKSEINAAEILLFVCEICEEEFPSKEDLDSHSSTHKQKKYSCTYCLKAFNRKDCFASHVRTHTGERPFKCDVCNKTFTQRNALTTHMTLHTGKTVKCTMCDKTFSRPSFLKVHYREHTNERPYACDMCPKRYKQMIHLRTHQLNHFNAKPYPCKVCGKNFSQKSSLNQHLYTHTEKPYKCPLCPLECIRMCKFRKHLVSVHDLHDDPKLYSRHESIAAKVNLIKQTGKLDVPKSDEQNDM